MDPELRWIPTSLSWEPLGHWGCWVRGMGVTRSLQDPVQEQVGPLFGSRSWGHEQVHTTMFVLGQGHQGLGRSRWVRGCVWGSGQGQAGRSRWRLGVQT